MDSQAEEKLAEIVRRVAKRDPKTKWPIPAVIRKSMLAIEKEGKQLEQKVLAAEKRADELLVLKEKLWQKIKKLPDIDIESDDRFVGISASEDKMFLHALLKPEMDDVIAAALKEAQDVLAKKKAKKS